MVNINHIVMATTWLTSPSKIPVPSVATLGATYHSLSFNLVSCRALITSSGLRSKLVSVYSYSPKKCVDIRPWISCLLANTSKSASFISRSLIILWSSERASSIRTVSLESTTKIRPWVPICSRLTPVLLACHCTLSYRNSSVAIEAGSCPGHQRPRHWIWHSYTWHSRR